MFDRHGRRWPPAAGRRLNLGSGEDVRPASEGWVNMDGYVAGPGVIRHDFVATPYPFPDNHFDYVYASHVLEHIPPIFRRWNGVQRDVLYDVMEEIHRILKPGGVLHVLVPYGNSSFAMSNPQHYRQWRPEWFRFFNRQGMEAVEYQRADLRLERLRLNKSGFRLRHRLLMGKSRLGLAEHLLERLPWLFWWLRPRHEIEAWLVARKDGAAPRR